MQARLNSYFAILLLNIVGAVVLTLISFWQHPLELPRIVTLVVSLIGHFFIVEQLSWLVPVNGETSVLICKQQFYNFHKTIYRTLNARTLVSQFKYSLVSHILISLF